MARWRTLLAIILIAVAGLPALLPFCQLLSDPAAWRVWCEAGRLLELACSSLVLVAGTLLITLPLGLILAVLFYRTNLPGSRLLRGMLVLLLFVPLPFTVSGWQPLISATAVTSGWRQGLISAIVMHALAALPWIVFLVGNGLRSVERDLEEESLTLAGPARALWHVSQPRALASIGAAALWVALLTVNEIAVCDMLQVRTFAEEVYTQFVAPESVLGSQGDPVARALAASVPFVLLTTALVVWMVRRCESSLPPAEWSSDAYLFPLHRWRVPATIVTSVLITGLLAAPLASLAWRAGQGGSATGWSCVEAARQLGRALRTDGVLIFWSVFAGLFAGCGCATLALLLCWASRGTRIFQALVLGLAALIWSMPAPVLGVGLKETIHLVLDVTGSATIADWLFYGPSLAPLVWIDVVRFLPLALALLWPVVRLVPTQLLDSARVEGASPGQEVCQVVWPLVHSAWLRAVLAVAILSLGELSAGKLVATPGRPGYAQELFARMHYGVTPDLAAGCLLLLGTVTIAGSTLILLGARPSPAAT